MRRYAFQDWFRFLRSDSYPCAFISANLVRQILRPSSRGPAPPYISDPIPSNHIIFHLLSLSQVGRELLESESFPYQL
jgi:hypothetical protein